MVVDVVPCITLLDAAFETTDALEGKVMALEVNVANDLIGYIGIGCVRSAVGAGTDIACRLCCSGNGRGWLGEWTELEGLIAIILPRLEFGTIVMM